ncbi:increased loss of mitochondrial DNA protein 1 [Elsinoe ampelina]|uniref:Increased loss of mitochondrial DNA protein 1 n=1 Tax=Elsinoe ampelina TaxID=302913 RepID=A0A6A6G8R2_9PEZI|nr:increased loss of mitochondrial DNA protein 1 [Elsinoe ampelina]
MALISVFTLIRALSLFHIGCAYLLLVSPKTFAEQNMVMLLGDAMQLPETTDFLRPTEATAYAALILLFLGVSDLVASSLPAITSLEYWITQVPVRLFMLFSITSYTYLFKEDGMFGSGPAAGERATGELLRNNLVFATGFVEVSLWFWVFVLLRDERRGMAGKLAERRHEREELYGKEL